MLILVSTSEHMASTPTYAYICTQPHIQTTNAQNNINIV